MLFWFLYLSVEIIYIRITAQLTALLFNVDIMSNKKPFSILIFSRNDFDQLRWLINDIQSICDDIVIIDSSDSVQKAQIDQYLRKNGYTNIHIYHTVALGAVELLRPYGCYKCKNDWILQLDTDERVSPSLKTDISNIISSSQIPAFAIKRFEDRVKGASSNFFTWQIRLYDKRKIHYLGKLHEQPLIDGPIAQADPSKYYLLHMENKVRRDYGKLEMFQRLTYATLRTRLMDETSKFFMYESRQKKNLWSSLLSGWFNISRIARSLKETDEIAMGDYFLYYLIKFGVYYLKQRRINPIPLLSDVHNTTLRIKEWRSGSASDAGLAISTIIEREGMISYLGLGNPKNVDMLSRKYANFRLKGTDLAIYLLFKRYGVPKP